MLKSIFYQTCKNRNRLSKILLSVSFISLAFAGSTAAFAEPVGLDAMAQFDRLPYLNTQVISGNLGSYSRQMDNMDGFTGQGHYYTEGPRNRVLCDLRGPGVITKIFFTEQFAATGINLQIYFDGESTPRLDIPAKDIFTGETAPFLKPLVEDVDETSGTLMTYIPFQFEKSIKIVAAGVPLAATNLFFHVDYQIFPAGTDTTTWTGTEDSSDTRALWNNCGVDPKNQNGNTAVSGTASLSAGGTQTLLDIDGPRSLSSIKFDIPKIIPGNTGSPLEDVAESKNILNNTWIRIYWDFETTPSVDAPLGAFFGIGNFGYHNPIEPPSESSPEPQPYTARSILFGLDANNVLYNYFPMPFSAHAKVEIYSKSDSPLADIGYEIKHKAFTDSFDNVGYFKTRFAFSRVTSEDPFDYNVLDIQGSGKFVGVQCNFYGIPKALQSKLSYLEGDHRFFVDDSKTPIYIGTGTEEFYHGGWYFNNGTLYKTRALHGYTAREDWADASNIATYRLMPSDGINFRKHLTIGFEHGAGVFPFILPGLNNQSVGYWTLAFYYHKQAARMHLTDTLDVGDDGSMDTHNYTISGQTWNGNFTSGYEGPFFNVAFTDTGRAHMGYSQFDLNIDPDNEGVILRRTFDQRIGRQEAKVYVDGMQVGNWYRPETNATYRHRDDDFMIPEAYTFGKSRINVKIEFVSSAYDWNEFRYEAYALIPSGPIAPLPAVSGETYKLLAKCSGLPLDVALGSLTPGTNVGQFLDYGSDSQSWKVVRVFDNYYALVALHSGLVLEVANASSSNGGNIQVNAWSGADNQLWKMENTADGYVKLTNRNSEKVMEVQSGSVYSMANVQQNSWNNTDGQKWTLEAQSNVIEPKPNISEDVYFNIVNAGNGNLLDVMMGSKADGANVIAFPPDAALSQEWSVDAVGDGYYKITARHSGKVLTQGSDNNLVQDTWTGSDSQRWMIRHSYHGWYRIMCKAGLTYANANLLGSVVAADITDNDVQSWYLTFAALRVQE